jgi:hypothetical protein
MGHGYYIDPFIVCPNPTINHKVLFRLDTGCDITTISYSDHYSLGLNYTILRSSEFLTADGNMSKNYLITNCGLYFISNDHKTLYAEQLDNILLSCPKITPDNHNTIMSIPSLLGMDFLKHRFIKFTENFVTID